MPIYLYSFLLVQSAYLFGIVLGMGLVGISLTFAIDEWVRAFLMLRRGWGASLFAYAAFARQTAPR